MSEPFVGEIRMFAFDWPPRDWAKCDGQILDIAQNQTLYSLFGTAFGGNGTSSFGLPEMRGRSPLGIGTLGSLHISRGEMGGYENVTLSIANMPSHTHNLGVDTAEATKTAPLNTRAFAKVNPSNAYASPNNLVACNPDAVTNSGGGKPHNNIQPSSVTNFCVSLKGLYPQRP